MKKTIYLTLYLSEIAYDIMLQAHVMSDSLTADDTAEQSAKIDETDGDNRNQILRSIGTAYSALRGQLSEYLAEDNSAADDLLLKEKSDEVKTLCFGTNGEQAKTADVATRFTIALRVPSNFNTAVADALAASLHECIVDNALASWLTLHNSAAAQTFAAEAQNAALQIQMLLAKRVRPTRTHLPSHDNVNKTDIRYE